MPAIFYQEVFVSCLLGGWAAWMTGRACALTWRSYHMAAFYMLPLSGVVRYIHYVIFESSLTSLPFYLLDGGILLILCSLGFRITKVNLMVRQYSWLYKKTSPLTWKDRQAPPILKSVKE